MNTIVAGITASVVMLLIAGLLFVNAIKLQSMDKEIKDLKSQLSDCRQIDKKPI